MLQINPRKRPSAEQVLQHSFFQDTPESFEFDFGDLLEEKTMISTFAKPKPTGVPAPPPLVPTQQQPVQTVDLTQKPSLLGKRTSAEAGLNGDLNVDDDDDIGLFEDSNEMPNKKPRLNADDDDDDEIF